MPLENLLAAIPEYAKDLRLNLATLLWQSPLTPQQFWGAAAASAIAGRNAAVTSEILSEARAQLSLRAFQAAQTAAAIMGMNNVYYRFLHLTENEKYTTVPAGLRMNGLRGHGIDQNDFELWCTAVSAINNCAVCVKAHEQALRQQGVSERLILAAVRVAAVVQAISVVFDAEAAPKHPAALEPRML